jgi:hypothetical protein
MTEIAGKPLFSLAEAARRHFPCGTLKKSGLYSEIQKGRLKAVKIAGKLFVTDSDIQAMIEAARCEPAVRPKAQGSISASAQDAPPSGSSETERASIAQAAALRTARELTKRSKPTSPTNTPRRPVHRLSTNS